MRIFALFFPERRDTATVARERLKIVLAHERASSDAADFLPSLQKELLDVVGRYVEIHEDVIRVKLGKSGDTSLLEINVEIDADRIKACPSSATTPMKPEKPGRIDPRSPTPWVRPS